jgi:hypothetical protein
VEYDEYDNQPKLVLMPPFYGICAWDAIETLKVPREVFNSWDFKGYSDEGFEVRSPAPDDTKGQLTLALAALDAVLRKKQDGCFGAAKGALETLETLKSL